MRRLALMLLLLSGVAYGQGAYYQNNAFTATYINGTHVVSVIDNSFVQICTTVEGACTPAAIFTDEALTAAMGNPIAIDGYGNFGFWITPGTYSYRILDVDGQELIAYPFTVGGAGGTGCTPGGTNYVIRSDGSGGCAGDNKFTYNPVAGSGLVNINQGVHFEIDGVDDSNYTFMNGDQILVRNFGDDAGTSMIPFVANQSDGLYTGGADIIVDFDAVYEVDKNGGKATGFLTEPGVGSSAAANTIEGFHSGAPSMSGTIGKVYGFHQSGAGPSSTTEEFSFFSETTSTPNITAGYCDFMARTDDVTPSPRFKLGCGQGAVSTFSGTVIAPIYQETLTTPSTSSAACTAGQFTDDAFFHYVCTATNTWKRVALSSF